MQRIPSPPLFYAAALGLSVVSLLGSDAARAAAPSGFPGTRSSWKDFDQYEFPLDGRACRVVVPRRIAPGRPWIWRARFWGHEPQVDLALLARGYHVAYMDVAGLYGAPEAVAHWNTLYEYLTNEHALSNRPALEGMSRGGLIVFNWAIANAKKVACIYVDAPVCDFKSWPGGRGRSSGSETDWQRCLAAYRMTEEEALAFQNNPIDRLPPLAEAGVPLLLVYGDADTVVPIEENTLIVYKRYRTLGGSVKLIGKDGVGHHPHGLNDPTPIVEFILRHTRQ